MSRPGASTSPTSPVSGAPIPDAPGSAVPASSRLSRASAQPSFAPLFAAAEESCQVRWLTAGYRTSADALQAVLPGTLRADRERPEVAVWMAEFATARFNTRDGQVQARPSYLQGGVSVRCLRAGHPGAYALLTFIEGLNHGLLGRELFGLPKKQAQHVYLDDQTLSHLQANAPTSGSITQGTSSSSSDVPVEGQKDAGSGGAHHGHRQAGSPIQRVHAGIVTAGGLNLIHVEAELQQSSRLVDPLPDWFSTHYTHKLIPSADGDGFDVSRLVRIPWRTSHHQGTQQGTASVHISPSSIDPLHLLPVEVSPPGNASYGWTTLDISFGRYVEEVSNFPTLGVPGW